MLSAQNTEVAYAVSAAAHLNEIGSRYALVLFLEQTGARLSEYIVITTQ